MDFNVSKLIDEQIVKNMSDDENLQRLKFKHSMFSKTGTPIYTAPEMHTLLRYK